MRSIVAAKIITNLSPELLIVPEALARAQPQKTNQTTTPAQLYLRKESATSVAGIAFPCDGSTADQP